MSRIGGKLRSKQRDLYVVIEENGELRLRNCGYEHHLAPSYKISEESAAKFKSIEVDDIVVSYKRPSHRNVTLGRVVGHKDTHGIESLISAYEVGLKMEFTKASLKEVKKLSVPGINDERSAIVREDLRDIPLVTIDPVKASDFDDAIYAEKITEENVDRIRKIIRRKKDFKGNLIENKDLIGGYYALSAIADVAHYVRPNTALDKEAKKRGVTAYIPNLINVMLDRRLSNGLCSLKPNEDRACASRHMLVSPKGELIVARVGRAIMHSHARLEYGQVQRAMDLGADEQTAPFIKEIKNLYELGSLVWDAKLARGGIDIDSKEYEFDFNKLLKVLKFRRKTKYNSNRIVASFALLNNQGVGELLREDEALFRVHAKPRIPYRFAAFAEELNKKLKDADKIKVDIDNLDSDSAADILMQIRSNSKISKDDKEQAEEEMLGCQQAAEYSTRNIGHDGLKLEAYIHDSSPIRRYADIIIHRLLIRKFNLGNDGATDEEIKNLSKIGEHCTVQSRLAKKAEDTSKRRYLAQYYKKDIGKIFEAKVTGMNGNGAVVRVRDDMKGVVPIEHMIGGKQMQFDSVAEELKQNAAFAKTRAAKRKFRLFFNCVDPNSLIGKWKYKKVERDFKSQYENVRALTRVAKGQNLKVRMVDTDHLSGKIIFEQVPTIKQKFYFSSIKTKKQLSDYLYDNFKPYKNRKDKRKYKYVHDPKWVL